MDGLARWRRGIDGSIDLKHRERFRATIGGTSSGRRKMALRAQFSLIHSEFNEFLFAPVGEEENGTALTVLSALTRLGVDPWREAARLSELPRDAAARMLAAAIAVLPEGDWEVSDAPAIAARLVDRLPSRGTPIVPPAERERTRNEQTRPGSAKWLLWAALAAALLLSLSPLYDHHAPEPAPSTATFPLSLLFRRGPVLHVVSGSVFHVARQPDSEPSATGTS
jgi:hypothetical protein